MEKKLITAEDTIFDIVIRYPEVKERLLELSPRYQNLNNPLIFNTVARLTTVRKAAAVGNIYLREMLYQLNDAIGLGEAYLEQEKKTNVGLPIGIDIPTSPEQKPSWWEKRTGFLVLDVRQKAHPFQEITSAAEKLQPGEGLLVLQGFVPYPLIDYLKTQGYEIFYETEGEKVTLGIYKKEA